MAPPGESIDGTEQAEDTGAAQRAQRGKPAIALITAVGSIVTGKGAMGELQQVRLFCTDIDLISSPACTAVPMCRYLVKLSSAGPHSASERWPQSLR